MESHRIYFSTINSEHAIWEIYVDDIELLAGMLAASVGIMDNLNVPSNYQLVKTMRPPGKSEEYYIDSDTDVSSFRILADIPEEDVRRLSVGRLQEGQYGIWLKGSRRFAYNLYTFQTNKFFQGIVSICDSFQVDFRDYLYGFPFDRYGNLYALSGYVMAQSQIGVDAPDLDDIEIDEADDENIIESLARTDVILTFKDESPWMI